MMFKGLSKTTKYKYRVILTEVTCRSRKKNEPDQTMTQTLDCKTQEDAFAAINELRERYSKQHRNIEITYEKVAITVSRYWALEEGKDYIEKI